MGLLKKIFKPVSKVLDKVIPNEIKPALPFAAAFAPFIAPGIMGTTVMQRALMGGGLNIFGQLAQEGNEGDINLLSAGLGALSGAMTAPGSGPTIGEGVKGAAATGSDAGFFLSEGVPLKGTPSAAEFFQGISDSAQGTGILASGQKFLGDTLVKGSNIMGEGIKQGLFTKAGAKAALLPAATATGDVMEAQQRQIDKQAAIDAALAEAEALGDSGARADAIRNAMRAYGFFTDEEIEETISSAGYKKGGRVGFDNGGEVSFGGITEAVKKIEEKPKEFLVDKLKVTMKPGQSEMRAIIEAMYNDVDGVMPDDRKKEFYELYAPQMYRNGEMEKSEFEFIQTEILGKEMKKGGRVGLREGGVSLIEQITAQNFIPGLGRPGFQPFARPLLSAGQMPVFPRLRELEQGIDTAESDLGSIRSRLGNQEGRLGGLTAIQPAFGLQPFARNPFLQNTLRSAIEPQGMKEGGLMDLGGKEMDLRSGGFVPIGKKERADDVPARLSKNEFVMTADAVRAAGGGSVTKGAKRMYNLMNNLEARA